MRNQTFVLTIEPWDDGPCFEPVLHGQGRGQGYPICLRPGFDTGNEGATLNRSLKPVGFYVAYSYTLFRTGNRPPDPLYKFF